MRLLLTAILLTAVSLSGYALTLEEAVESAKKNSWTVKRQGALVETARSEMLTSRSSFMPKLDASYNYNKSNRDTAYVTNDEYSKAALTLSYNLFNGFSDISTYKSKSAEYDASVFQKDAAVSDLVLNVKHAYFNVLNAKKDITTAQEAVALLEKQLKDVNTSYEVGIMSKNELLKVKVELANSRQSLLSAESRFRLAVKNLANLTGTKIEDEEPFAEAAAVEKENLDIDELADKMYQNRYELKYLYSVEKSVKYSKTAAKSGHMPKVNLSASYNAYGDDAAVSGRDNNYDDEGVFGASATWNIFNGGKTKYSVRTAAARLNEIRFRINQTRNDMLLQLETAVENYRLSAGSLKVAQTALASAEENYRITESRFRQNTATNTELLDARYYLTRARGNFYSASYNLLKAMAEIERVSQSDVF